MCKARFGSLDRAPTLVANHPRSHPHWLAWSFSPFIALSQSEEGGLGLFAEFPFTSARMKCG